MTEEIKESVVNVAAEAPVSETPIVDSIPAAKPEESAADKIDTKVFDEGNPSDNVDAEEEKEEIAIETPNAVEEVPNDDDDPYLQDVLDASDVTDVPEGEPLPDIPVTNTVAKEEIKYDCDYSELSLFDVAVGNSIDDLSKIVQSRNPTGEIGITRKIMINEPESQFAKVITILGHTGQNVELSRIALEGMHKKNDDLSPSAKNNLCDSLIKSLGQVSKDGTKRKLTGKEAKLAVFSCSKGLRKVMLLNSGFWVVLRPIQLTELSQWYNKVADEAKGFGNLIGGHSFMFSDVFLRQKFMELLSNIVVDSNLEDWNVTGRLARVISIQDVDTLMWAVSCMIYKEGITVDIHCTDPNCKFVANNAKLDLTKLRFDNMSIIPKDALGFISSSMFSDDRIKIADLKKYSNQLGLKKSFVVGGVTYYLHVPSAHNFCETGAMLIKTVLAAVDGNPELNKSLEAEFKVNLATTYLPWVYRIETADFETTDKEAILAQLELGVRESPELADKIFDYQYSTKLSYFCYTLLECPKCHKTPSDVIKDYYPLDVIYLFFCLSSRVLEQVTAG